MCLRIARKIAGLSQKELALKSGINMGVISRIETGERKLTNYNQILRLAHVFGVTPPELMSFVEFPDPISFDKPKPARGRRARAERHSSTTVAATANDRR
jgi:transcriptional regulator with XRE-family HTH domain